MAQSRKCKLKTCVLNLSLTASADLSAADRPVLTLCSTTIPVSPQYLPTGVYDGVVQAKRVDYGIYLSQSYEQRQLLRDRLEARTIAPDNLCVNQTPVYAEYIRWLPQLLAIETKTNESSGVSAEAQLAIWMAGLRKKLETLRNSDSPGSHIKPMPCLKVQGFEWKMYWCSVNARGETVSATFHTIVPDCV